MNRKEEVPSSAFEAFSRMYMSKPVVLMMTEMPRDTAMTSETLIKSPAPERNEPTMSRSFRPYTRPTTMAISRNQAVRSPKYQSPRLLPVRILVWSKIWMPNWPQGIMPTIITTKETANNAITTFWRVVNVTPASGAFSPPYSSSTASHSSAVSREADLLAFTFLA